MLWLIIFQTQTQSCFLVAPILAQDPRSFTTWHVFLPTLISCHSPFRHSESAFMNDLWSLLSTCSSLCLDVSFTTSLSGLVAKNPGRCHLLWEAIPKAPEWVRCPSQSEEMLIRILSLSSPFKKNAMDLAPLLPTAASLVFSTFVEK